MNITGEMSRGSREIPSHGSSPTTSHDENGSNSVVEQAFLQRQATRMANNPCLYFWLALLVSLAISVVAIMKGGLSIEVSSKGWTTRGTTIADRQTASMLVRMHKDYLSKGGEEAWKDLTSNVQPSWESFGSQDASGRRRLRDLPTTVPIAQAITSGRYSNDPLHFNLTSQAQRRMKPEIYDTACNADFYADKDLTKLSRLWPVWESTSGRSLFDPNELRELCLAEEATQLVLSDHGLCFGCQDSCLPPFSIVLLARLSVPHGFGMTCDELHEAWKPYQTGVETKIKACIHDIRASAINKVTAGSLPDSCPFGFSPHMVDLNFEETGTLFRTSSIFVTDNEYLGQLYDLLDEYDRGGILLRGAYDTQKQNFNFRYQTEALRDDMALALGSSLIVAVAVLIHTRSPLVTLVGLLQILLSFPLAYFIYVWVAGYSYFPVLNFIGVFVVFAIGADDVFVAVDKWKDARLGNLAASTPEIAELALPDAAKAMLSTTLTTTLAFFATAACPVAPIKLFAVFVGLLVIVVYSLCILLVFPLLCIYDRALQKDEVSPRCFIAIDYQRRTEVDSEGTKSSYIHGVMVSYHEVVYRQRYVLLFVCLVVLGLCIDASTKLQQPRSLDIRLLKESNEFERNHRWRQTMLYEDLKRLVGSTSFIFWGVLPADTGNHDDPDSFSQLVLDKSFDPSSVEAQLFLLGFCDDFYAQDFASKVSPDYACPVPRFDKWLRKQHSARSTRHKSVIYSSQCNNTAGVPVPEEIFRACFSAWAHEVKELDGVLRNEHVPILFLQFNARVGYKDHYQDLKRDFWLIERWLRKKMDTAPKGVNRAFFIGGDFWFMDTFEAMTASAYSSAGIALASSAMVILAASKSISLTFCSLLSILYVLVSTIATIVALGWTLGFLECICIAILIGISADFVTHLSVAYVAPKGKVRKENRTAHALVHMGPSILASAITTGGAAVIMVFTVILFFQKFAFVLLFTILHSTLGSFVFFITLTNCFGPSEPDCLVSYVKKAVYRAVQSLGGGKVEEPAEIPHETTEEESNSSNSFSEEVECV
jgi:hypothetical protein